MKVKSILVAAAVAILAIGFATPAFAAIGNQGRILYTKNVVRNADGTIASTGNLFVKDLATGTEQQVTNYTAGIILNPMFNKDGKKIIYTSNVPTSGVDANTYKVYLVSSSSSISPGVGIELRSGVANVNYKYAALSPDENTIAFVYEDTAAVETSLWTYDRIRGLYQRVYADPINGIEIRHVVFVNNTTVAFIGKSAGIQNIYLVDLTGPTVTKITNNTSGTVEYISLKSAFKSAAAGNMLIYSKRIKSGAVWGPFDVYATISLTPFLEVSVTQTSGTGQNEYEACFYGDDAAIRDVQLTAQNGNMLYIARIIGAANKVWQANFDTTGGSTNTGITQRTVDNDAAGQPDWAPPITEQAPVAGIGDTEIVYIANDNGTPEVWIADFDDTGTLLTGTPISVWKQPPSPAKDNPSLGYGRVAFDDTTNGNVALVNSDGTEYRDFDGTSTIAKMPFITPDGKWVVFVAGANDSNKQLYAKQITKTTSDPAIAITGITVTNAEDPVVSPDMSTLVWVDRTSTGSSINKIGVVFDADNNTVTVIGTQMTLAGNTGQCNDKNPRFSPDGTKIIFVSDRDSSNKIYTMDAGTGLGVTLFNIDYATNQNPAYPVYSPLNDGSIAFVAGLPGARTIRLATAQGAVTDTGRLVDRDKFDWKFERTAGEITAERTLQSRASAGTALTYSIKIDIDDAKKPVSYTLEEVIPSWSVNSVKLDGNTLTLGTNYYELDNTPAAGLKTLRFVFANTGGSAGTVADHVLTFNITPAGSGTKSFSGTISYFMNGQAQSALVTGNGILDILNPYCPVDKYNSKKEANKPDGVIQDLDLLYGIEAWSTGAQLPGFGTGWPAYPDLTWDDIILAVINIWASPAGTQGYYAPSGGGANQQVTTASTIAGEYQYIGDRDSDTLLDVYAPSAVGSGVSGMYWTQGEWQD
ncbi:MAG: hypothetical protein NC913_03345 [Candidatus Omnitrophica bacterium]|nr:hypothetical protein [Candidatus Omnitrophota bacterium]